MQLPHLLKRIYDAVVLSFARKQGLEPKGLMLYERSTGKPLLGTTGEALDHRFRPKRLREEVGLG